MAVVWLSPLPRGVVVHTGDFKIDPTPIDGVPIDLNKFADYGTKGVLLLLSDSTNVEREGYTLSEKVVGEEFDRIFPKAKRRIIVACFASNIHRRISGSMSPHQDSYEELTEPIGSSSQLKKWLPLLAAVILVGAVLWFFLRTGGGSALTSSTQPQAPEIVRPLGLYVDPTGGQTWRVSWNPNATALHNARNVQLFVHENGGLTSDDLAGDSQNRTLTAQDLASGSYEYRPVGNDVTFRLEVNDQTGRVLAESFRLVRSQNTPAPAPPTEPAAPAEAVRVIQPKAVYRAPAVVAAGVRSRIAGRIPIDVRVQIDVHGHVVSATPVTRARSDIGKYLAARAVQAAKQWRFEPARDNGKPVPGAQILHFVFEK